MHVVDLYLLVGIEGGSVRLLLGGPTVRVLEEPLPWGSLTLGVGRAGGRWSRDGALPAKDAALRVRHHGHMPTVARRHSC